MRLPPDPANADLVVIPFAIGVVTADVHIDEITEERRPWGASPATCCGTDRVTAVPLEPSNRARGI